MAASCLLVPRRCLPLPLVVMDNELIKTGPRFASLASMVEQQARSLPDRTAFVFEDDAGRTESLSYQELAERSRTLGSWLTSLVEPGDRVLLVYPPGLEFIAAFMGCVYAGALPVPATYPKPKRPMPRLDSIAADCHPSLVLTQSSVLDGVCLDQQSAAISSLAWEATDKIATQRGGSFRPIARSGHDLAFLQYTSGSTSEPRGVMVSHGNIMHNLEAIQIGFGIRPEEHTKGVFWLPAYHDMGLIGGILTPLYVGGTSTLIGPTTFLRRPQRWLELISATKASISGAPNFAYELAERKTSPVERNALDLSYWRLAFCGAEPINSVTLAEFAEAFADAGFKASAFFPCYGLAESTLLVAGGQSPAGPRVLEVDRQAMRDNRVVLLAERNGRKHALVSCGPKCLGVEVEIVDPKTHASCGKNEIGEIWVRGDSIARGYWNKEVVNTEVFRAKLAANGSSHEEEYLRTGDLGFYHEGELFVTGRLKDVVIVRGRNHYPHDLERTAQAAHEAVELGAAFSIDVDGHEELVLVHQLRRESRNADHNQVLQAIRAATVEEHEIDPYAIVLIRPASLPMTSSGKVQRQRCREQYLNGELAVTAEWVNQHVCDDAWDGNPIQAVPPLFLDRIGQIPTEQLRSEMLDWLIAWLAVRANLMPGAMQARTPFAQLGIDSLTAVEISQELDQLLGLQSPPMVIWSCPTPEELADYLIGELQTAKA